MKPEYVLLFPPLFLLYIACGIAVAFTQPVKTKIDFLQNMAVLMIWPFVLLVRGVAGVYNWWNGLPDAP